MKYDYDFFVIGAGSGGVRAARMAARFGVSVGIAEDRYLGGTCVNVGCVPKKLFVYGSHYSEHLEDSHGYGWKVGNTDFDWAVLRDNKTQEIHRLNGIYRRLLEQANVTIYEAHAKLVDEHTLLVGDQTITAKTILIATGGWPSIPDFPGRQFCISSNEVFYLNTFPKRILVVGGGYIAVEFAGIFAGLGAQTVLTYRRDLPLRGFDNGVRHFALDEMRKKQIDFRLNTTITCVDQQPQGLVVELNDGTQITTDCVLFATGRAPKTDGLGLDQVGVSLRDNGAIIVNDYYQTNIPSIYALGDVIDKVQLTPVAITEAMALVQTLFNNNPTVVDYRAIPTAVFCQPTIGTVGLTEEQAKTEYANIDVYQSAFKPMVHTLTGRDEKTLMKLLVDKDSDKVVGAHMVGESAGEIIQGISIAMKAGATKAIFDATVGIHPTSAEEFVTMREPMK